MQFYICKVKKALYRRGEFAIEKIDWKSPTTKNHPYGWMRNFRATFTPVTKNLGVNHSCHQSKLALAGVIFTPVWFFILTPLWYGDLLTSLLLLYAYVKTRWYPRENMYFLFCFKSSSSIFLWNGPLLFCKTTARWLICIFINQRSEIP